MPRIVRLSLVLFLMAGGLSACGKRGQLDPPPSQKQAVEDAEAAAPAPKAAGAKATEASGGQTKLGARKRIPITPPKRELLIDRLLD
ncbi:MAG: hypothetical protein FD175_2852 [Beijerinckiaceae bacterium]|nr:MAG: hypothetical protein FD175_2852 [Beijerinckiaceae bacterium]